MPPYALTLIQNPSGTYGFVGSVPGVLAYVHKDGTTPTNKEIEDDLRLPPQFRKLKSRSWPTKQMAIDAANIWGYNVSFPVTR